MRGRNTEQAGLTLIELMVALVIVSIAIAAAFAFGWSVMNAYKDQRVSDKVSRAARGSLDIISKAVRAGSPGVPSGQIHDLVNCSGSGGVNVINSSTGPDELSVVYASGGVVNTLRNSFTATDTTIPVYDASLFQQGDLIVVTDFQEGHLLRVTGKTVTAAIDDSDEIDVDAPNGSGCLGTTWPAADYNQGDMVVRAKIARFFVDTSVTGRPALIMDLDNDPGTTGDQEPLALGVEDMQIAVGVDENGDGDLAEIGAAVNDDEWYFNVGGESTPPLPWHALRITLVARSLQERSQQPISTPFNIEDHSPGASADPFRRRPVHAIIQLRNMEPP